MCWGDGERAQETLFVTEDTFIEIPEDVEVRTQTIEAAYLHKRELRYFLMPPNLNICLIFGPSLNLFCPTPLTCRRTMRVVFKNPCYILGVVVDGQPLLFTHVQYIIRRRVSMAKTAKV
jgi:hypothetical protein